MKMYLAIFFLMASSLISVNCGQVKFEYSKKDDDNYLFNCTTVQGSDETVKLLTLFMDGMLFYVSDKDDDYASNITQGTSNQAEIGKKITAVKSGQVLINEPKHGNYKCYVKFIYEGQSFGKINETEFDSWSEFYFNSSHHNMLSIFTMFGVLLAIFYR